MEDEILPPGPSSLPFPPRARGRSTKRIKTASEGCARADRPKPEERGGAQELRRPSAVLRSGARRDRTDDLMLAKHALSQLSYGPG